MSADFKTDNPELEALFERYRATPGSHVFAPLADACRKAGMFEEAIEICEKGVSTHPRYASGFVVRGKCYYDLGNADQAEASFEKVLHLDANNLVALKYMGLILAARGEAEGARQYFEHILALDPDDKEIAEKLEELILKEASEILDDEASMSGLVGEDTPPAGDTAAESQEPTDDGQFVGAEITLGGQDQTTDVLATMTLAEIYASQGYRGKAVKIFRELLSAEPENEAVRARLQELGETRDDDARSGAREVVPGETDETEPAATEPAQPSGVVPASQGRPAPGRESERRQRPRPSGQSARRGAPDEASASQFKRWLDNLHR